MSYVLITPVKNEERLIATTIDSVVNQTVLPAEWVIVSDGSTDRTDEIVRAAAAENPWIKLVQLPPREHRCFSAVVRATETGVRALTVTDYEYIGLLDSDLRFEKDYFERVIEEFERSPRLGLAGGVAIDVGLPKERFLEIARTCRVPPNFSDGNVLKVWAVSLPSRKAAGTH